MLLPSVLSWLELLLHLSLSLRELFLLSYELRALESFTLWYSFHRYHHPCRHAFSVAALSLNLHLRITKVCTEGGAGVSGFPAIADGFLGARTLEQQLRELARQSNTST